MDRFGYHFPERDSGVGYVIMEAKKSLGQNFLTSQSALAIIIETGDIKKGDFVLEIGPGKGALTAKLLEAGAQVVAVEKDHRLIPELKSTFENHLKSGLLEIKEQDILEFDAAPLSQPYKVIANIPYYITGQILRMFLETENQPEKLVLMIQKEVAERIVARDGKESILSISVKAYGEPKLIKTVPRGAFSPMPKVDSAIISIGNINRSQFNSREDELKFFDTVRRGFGQKRKQLKNNLGCSADILTSCGIEEKSRAEELTVDQWLCLSRKI